MSNWLYYLCCAAAVALLTFIVYRWNRGAQRRRFHKTFPKSANPFWTMETALFLAAVEDAYRLPQGWAKRLPPTSTPMGLYLALYPEHCIYDDCENDRFVGALKRHLKTKMPKEPLTQTFEMLLSLWLEVDATTP